MKQSHMLYIANFFRYGAFSLIVVMALYSALGREFIPRVGEYREDLEIFLSEQLNTKVEISELQGQWRFLRPAVTAKGITVWQQDGDNAALGIAELDMEVNVFSTLLKRAPVFHKIAVYGLSSEVHQNQLNQWHLIGVTPKPKTIKEFIDEQRQQASQQSVEKKLLNESNQSLVDIILSQNLIELQSVFLHLQDKKQQVYRVGLEDLAIVKLGNGHGLRGAVSFGERSQIATQFAMTTEGTPLEWDEFKGSGHIEVPMTTWDQWIASVPDLKKWMNKLQGSGQLWFSFEDGRINQGLMEVDIPSIEVVSQDPENPAPHVIENFSTRIQYDADDKKWQGWMRDTTFKYKDTVWSPSNVSIVRERYDWHIYLDRVDIQRADKLIRASKLLPSVDPYLKDIQPKGGIEHLNLTFNQKDFANTFEFSSSLIDVELLAWQGAPHIRQLKGRLAIDSQGGFVEFDSPNLFMHFPNLYQYGFQFEKGSGRVDWYYDNNLTRIWGQSLRFNHPQARALMAEFDLNFYSQDLPVEDWFSLTLDIQDSEVNAQSLFVPQTVDQNLREWLENGLLSGIANHAGVIYHGNISSGNQPHDESVQLFFDVEQAEIKYQEGWPTITDADGQLIVRNEKVFGEIVQAETLGGEISRAKLTYPVSKTIKKPGRIRINNGLAVSGQINGDAGEGLKYFQSTPIRSLVSGAFDQWSAKGLAVTKVDMLVPFDSDKVQVNLSSRLQNANLDMKNLNLMASNIKGEIRYSNSKGLTSENLHYQFFGNKAQTKIESKVFGNGAMSTDIGFNSSVSMEAVRNWLNLDLMKPLTGVTQYKGKLNIGEGPKPVLSIESDMVGVNIDLPEPYKKQPDDSKPLTLKLEVSDEMLLNMSVGGSANMALNITSSGVDRGQIYLGDVKAFLPTEPGLEIKGYIPSLNFNEWLATIATLQHQEHSNQKAANSVVASDKSANLDFIRSVELKTDLFTYDGFEVENLDVTANQSNSMWSFDVNSPLAKGKVSFGMNLEQPIDINLEYLHLPSQETPEESQLAEDASTNQSNKQSSKTGTKASTVKSEDTELDIAAESKAKVPAVDPLQDLNPETIPNLNFSSQEIFVGPVNYGAWAFNTRKIQQGIEFQQVVGQLKNLYLTGNIDWVKNKGTHFTQVKKLNLESNNLGAVQRGFRTLAFIEADQAVIDLDLTWKGSPLSPAVKSMTGLIAFDIQDGRLVNISEIDEYAGFKVLGILNMDAIFRRMSLDFSDVYQEGMSFDEFKGKVDAKQGLFSVVDTVTLDGPTGKGSLGGTLDFNSDEMDLEASVTVPVTNALPILAFLGGLNLPVVGGVYVTEKLFSDDLEKITSQTYQIKGSIDKPEVKLKDNFDNDIKGKKEKTWGQRILDVFGVGDDE